MHRAIVWLALVGCYSPNYREGLLCAAGDMPCPPGQSCFSGTCYLSSRDGAPDDTSDTADADIAPCTPGVGEFCLEPTPTVVGDLNAVWGASANQLWVVGNQGVWSYTPATLWRKESPPGSFEAVHGISSNAVWIVGNNGATWFWDGSTWRDQSAGINSHLQAVVGRSPADAFSAGGAINAFHYNGVLPWMQQRGGLTGDARALALVVGGTYYLGGFDATTQSGSLFEFEAGSVWTRFSLVPMPARAIESLYASTTSLYMAGADPNSGAVYRVNLSTEEIFNEVTLPARLYGVHGTSDADVWAVGTAGTVLSRTGATWNPVNGPSNTVTLRGVAVFPSRVWVVGDNGRVYSLVR